MKRALVAAILCYSSAFAESAESVRDSKLIEHATSRLAQIDVTVTGDDRAVTGLTAADFELRINHKLISQFIVDDFCQRATGNTDTALSQPDTTPITSSEPPRTATTTYLFYFDMAHLTQIGRQTAIESARELLPKLLTGRQRAMIVVNAFELKTVTPLTTDRARLDASLAKIVNDVTAFDPYSVSESTRTAEIIDLMATRPLPGAQQVTNRKSIGNPPPAGIKAALQLARRYAAEERWRQERDLRRLSMVLGRFADIDPTKAVLYFADTMRQNAGEHYLSLFGATNLADAKWN